MTVQELISLLQNCRPDAVVLMPGEMDCDTPVCVRPTECVTLDDEDCSGGGSLSDWPHHLEEYTAKGRQVLPAVILDVELDDPFESSRKEYEAQKSRDKA